MPHGPLKTKEKSYLTDAPLSDMPNTVKFYQAGLLHCQYNIHACWPSATPCREWLYRCSCNIYACWPSVAATNTAAVQTCLLVECCCKMDSCHSISMPADFLPLNPACLLAMCFSVCHNCWHGVSLSAVPVVWCLTLGHAFWCGASISAVPAGVVPHYRACLVVWYLTFSHVCLCGASL